VSMFVELCVLIVTVFGFLSGSCSIYWVKVRPSPRQARWGRCLFVLTLLLLGGVALVAALMRADGLIPLGLLSGLLTVGMLWDSPLAAATDESASSP
jgi:hypothetical protein